MPPALSLPISSDGTLGVLVPEIVSVSVTGVAGVYVGADIKIGDAMALDTGRSTLAANCALSDSTSRFKSAFEFSSAVSGIWTPRSLCGGAFQCLLMLRILST